MKATIASLALSTAVFAAHAEPPVIDREAQTITWKVNQSLDRQTLNCRLGIFSITADGGEGHLYGSFGAGTSSVDLMAADQGHNHVRKRIDNAREPCKKYALTPEF